MSEPSAWPGAIRRGHRRRSCRRRVSVTTSPSSTPSALAVVGADERGVVPGELGERLGQLLQPARCWRSGRRTPCGRPRRRTSSCPLPTSCPPSSRSLNVSARERLAAAARRARPGGARDDAVVQRPCASAASFAAARPACSAAAPGRAPSAARRRAAAPGARSRCGRRRAARSAAARC